MVTRRRATILLAAAAAALFLAASGCASRAHLPGALAPMLWPPAPEAPRIHLVGEFAGPEDLGLARGPIGRVIDWIAEPSENRLVRPYAVAVAGTAQGTGPGDTAAPGPAVIAVSDTGAKVVHLFDLEHRAHRVVSEVGDVRRLTSPVGVAFDAQRRLYVCDSVLAAVVRYQADGAFDRVISEGFARPAGIAIDAASGVLYVSDAAEHAVRQFDLDGKPLGLLQIPVRFPTHLAFASGRVLVCDSLGFRVLVVAPDGKVEASVGQLGDGSGDLQRPKGVALDSDGHVFVVDALFDNVQVFGQDGAFLLPFASRGSGPGELSLPAGLAIDARDFVYVADTFNGRVQVFRYLRE